MDAGSPAKGMKSNRSALELPTTEPGFYFYTSDEDGEECKGTTAGAKPGKLQHRQTSPPDGVCLKMPPELIITGTHSKIDGGMTDNQGEVECNKDVAREKSERNTVGGDLPPISGAKRNNSWHNFRKCVPIFR